MSCKQHNFSVTLITLQDTKNYKGPNKAKHVKQKYVTNEHDIVQFLLFCRKTHTLILQAECAMLVSTQTHHVLIFF